MVHYKSSYDNISAAIADNQPDSLSVVGIFLKEATAWDQWGRIDRSETIENLRKASLGLSRPWRGPSSPHEELEVAFDQFVSGIT